MENKGNGREGKLMVFDSYEINICIFKVISPFMTVLLPLYFATFFSFFRILFNVCSVLYIFLSSIDLSLSGSLSLTVSVSFSVPLSHLSLSLTHSLSIITSNTVAF